MILYHGTDEQSAKGIISQGVDLFAGSIHTDFGPGFYTTPDFDLAQKWAERKGIFTRGAVISYRIEELKIEGRNAVLEAFRSGKTIDKLYVLDGCQDGPVRSIIRAARKGDTIINFVEKSRLDQLSETGHHQGVIAEYSNFEYATNKSPSIACFNISFSFTSYIIPISPNKIY